MRQVGHKRGNTCNKGFQLANVQHCFETNQRKMLPILPGFYVLEGWKLSLRVLTIFFLQTCGDTAAKYIFKGC